jgi:hypothetical protein
MSRVTRCALVALFIAGAALIPATAALGNAPDPATTKLDQVVVNQNGSTTVTVEGTWTWQTQPNCPKARNGVGYQIDWFDNQTNAIGKPNDPQGILYVGTANDNIVHSDEPLGQSTAPGNAFWDGVPSSYLTHNQIDTTPTQTDAANWFAECSGLNGAGETAGSWGPISHTYAPTAAKPLRLCPIMYDPHGGSQNSGKSSVKDITAGANASSKGYNDDNSYETNQTGPGPGTCPAIPIPSLTTSASAPNSSGAIHDTATLSHASGSGTITFKLYQVGSGCSGPPLFTSQVNTNGSGDYQSGDFTPSQSGTYQWQASYDSSSVNGLITACGDPNEQSRIPPVSKPGLKVVKLASVQCADLATNVSQPSDITPCNATWSIFTRNIMTVSVPRTGSYAIPIQYQIQVTNMGHTPLTLSLSDPRCDPGPIAGPVQVRGTLTNNTLSAGGQAYYTCTHTLTQNDPNTNASGQPFTNTATVTGTPPSGPPIHRHSTVTVHRNPPPQRFCTGQRGSKKGKRIHWPEGKPKPKACRIPPRHPHPKRPKHPHGFTG